MDPDLGAVRPSWFWEAFDHFNWVRMSSESAARRFAFKTLEPCTHQSLSPEPFVFSMNLFFLTSMLSVGSCHSFAYRHEPGQAVDCLEEQLRISHLMYAFQMLMTFGRIAFYDCDSDAPAGHDPGFSSSRCKMREGALPPHLHADASQLLLKLHQERLERAGIPRT